MMGTYKVTFAFVCSIAGFLLTSPALAHDQLKSCDDPHVLTSISERFQRQSSVMLDQLLIISDFSKVHEHRVYDKNESRLIARRYCGATATLSDGRNREVWYLIESSSGVAGWGNGVEFCVSGFDRWNAYDAACRVLR
jgi:hypothetical protein